MRRRIYLLFYAITILGLFNMIFSWLVAFCFISPDFELPILGVSDAEMDGGNWYIGSSFNSRVQVYGSNGEYMGRISILNYAKPFIFHVFDGSISNFDILSQGVDDFIKSKTTLTRGKIEYVFKYHKNLIAIRQSLFIHFMFNPICGICLSLFGILGSLVTSKTLRNRLLLPSLRSG